MANEKEQEHTAKIVYPQLKEDEPVLYSNAIQVNHTPWDFALHFSQLVVPTSVTADVEVKARSVAVINIPVTLVRGLITALETNVTLYEKVHGKIDIPRKEEKSDGNGSAK